MTETDISNTCYHIPPIFVFVEIYHLYQTNSYYNSTDKKEAIKNLKSLESRFQPPLIKTISTGISTGGRWLL